jgi:AbrB family looped-hinge helix DNA binding protein
MNSSTRTIEQRGYVMPISKLGQRRQVVIPKQIWDELGLEIGNYVEVQRVKGTVVITPKKLVDRDAELTPEQKAVIDAGIAEGLEDMRQGRIYGPFDSIDAMLHSLHGAKPKKQSKTR